MTSNARRYEKRLEDDAAYERECAERQEAREAARDHELEGHIRALSHLSVPTYGEEAIRDALLFVLRRLDPTRDL